MRTVAIVGGGFSGTVTAINLVRLSRQPLQVVLINGGYPLGRGVAYSTRLPEHLLNVVARNMSALADQPSHFVEWLRTRYEYADMPEPVLREQFIPRRIYGDYLQSLLFWHTKVADARAVGGVESIHGEAVDITVNGSKATITVEGNRQVQADKVILATGNNAPVELFGDAACAGHPGFVDNPWKSWDFQKQNTGDLAILVGAGLTMIDAFLTIKEGGWKGKIVAISRNGIFPLSHFKGIEYPNFPPEEIVTYRLNQLVALIEEHCAKLRKEGNNPAIVIDKLRPYTQRIWDQLTLEEKQEFNRKYRTIWGAYRHRIAESVHRQLTDAIECGKLEIIKGKIKSMGADGQELVVQYDDDASGRACTLTGSLAVNCTGPRESYARDRSPLFTNLFARGLIQSDALDMGLRVAKDHAVIDKDGLRSQCLYAMGPLLKGTLWETTAVPELRIQAFQIAENVLAIFEGKRQTAVPEVEAYADVLEYCI
jgi:uncharacterized NAD(P)/FAD-binding protein YdhS